MIGVQRLERGSRHRARLNDARDVDDGGSLTDESGGS